MQHSYLHLPIALSAPRRPQPKSGPIAKQPDPYTENNAPDSAKQDLIAQVRDDKSVDQALLRLLILANLRSAPSSLVAHNQQQPAAYGPGSARLALDGGSQEALGPLVQRVPLEDLASIETLGGDLSQIYSQDQLFQNQMDKREYIKPCSFNAVSCAKNPFRKF